MDKIIKPGKAVPGFGVGTMGTCGMEIGPRYHGAMLVFIATAAAGQTLTLADFCAMITAKLNAKPQRIHLATELDAIQTSYGSDYAASIWNYDTGVINYVNGAPQAAQVAKQTICFLPLWFAEPWRKTWAGAELFAWTTAFTDGSSVPSFELEITGGPATNLLAGTNITCQVYPEYDSALGGVDATTKQPVFLINKWQRNPTPYGGAGDLQILNLPKKDAYQEIRFFCQPGDYINRVQCLVNSKVVRDVTQGVNNTYLLGRGFNPAFINRDRFDLIFDGSDKPSDALAMSVGGKTVRDFSMIVTLAAAAAGNKQINVLSQRYGPPD